MYQQHMLLKLRKPILKYKQKQVSSCPLAFMSIGFPLLKHLKLPISIKIPVTIWQIVYIYMTAISANLISRTMLLLSWQLHGSMKNKSLWHALTSILNKITEFITMITLPKVKTMVLWILS